MSVRIPKLDRSKKMIIDNESEEKNDNKIIDNLSNSEEFVKNNLTTEIIKNSLNSEDTDNLIKSLELIDKIKYYKELKYDKNGDTRVLLSEENTKFLEILKNVFKITYVDSINLMIAAFREENKKIILASKEYKQFKKSLE